MKIHAKLVTVFVLTLALLAAAPYNMPAGGCNCAPGDLDETFDGDGLVTGGWAYSDDRGWAVAVQQDGKIIMAGYTNNFGNERFEVLRFTATGAPDDSFGFMGLVTTSFGDTRDFARDIAIQADGKIVVAGYSIGATAMDFAIARYNSNGSLDTTFDSDGKATYNLGSASNQAFSVAIQPDGKILMAGISSQTYLSIALLRLNSNGSPDSTFNGGDVITTIGTGAAYGEDMAIQPDGKILVAGHILTGANPDALLLRYNSSGSLDTTFGDNLDGIVISELPGDDRAYAVAIQTDGKIIIAGSKTGSGMLIQYNSNGIQLGSTFINQISQINALAEQVNGKILAAGHKYLVTADFVLLRVNYDLTYDASFKTGSVSTDFGNSQDYGNAIAIQPDGKIVVAGYTTPADGSPGDFALARYWGDRYVYLPLLVK